MESCAGTPESPKRWSSTSKMWMSSPLAGLAAVLERHHATTRGHGAPPMRFSVREKIVELYELMKAVQLSAAVHLLTGRSGWRA